MALYFVPLNLFLALYHKSLWQNELNEPFWNHKKVTVSKSLSLLPTATEERIKKEGPFFRSFLTEREKRALLTDSTGERTHTEREKKRERE